MARTYKRDSRGRFASGGGGSSGGRSGGKRSTPKTTTARGRALQNQRRASDLVRAGRGGSGPSKKAVRSAVTAMRARAYYAATGTGTKRSAKKAVSATKKRKQVRTEIGAKAAEARVKSAGRPRARVVAKPARSIRPTKTAAQIKAQADRLLDKLKGQKLGNYGSRRYTLESRISRVNAAAKRSMPTYRHNPLRKGGSASKAYREMNRQYGSRARASSNIARGQRDIRGY